jgi:hypothetical protein
MSNLSNLSRKLPTSLCDSAGGGAVIPDNARFITRPEPFVLHIVCSILFCMPGSFQLGSALRQRFPRLHRSIKQHKAWIVRAYALVLGAGTQVLIMFPMTSVAGASPFFFYVLMAWA